MKKLKDYQKKALNTLKNLPNSFMVMGEAGMGKSYALKYLAQSLQKQKNKENFIASCKGT